VGGIRIVCFPADDAGLRERMESVMRGIPSNGGAPRDLVSRVTEALRAHYPNAVVRPREELAELDASAEPTWYVYRDGTATVRPETSTQVSPA
jgi:hypothetical protein